MRFCFWNREKGITHLTDSEIIAVREDTLSSEEFRAHVAHLRKCKKCTDRLFSRITEEQAMSLCERLDRMIEEDAYKLGECLGELANKLSHSSA